MLVAPEEPDPVPPVPVEVVPYDPAWPELFAAESAKVAALLGHLVDGGVLDGLEHMGSTSVPELCAKPTIDMLGRVHPYPPSQEVIDRLASLGYTFRGEYGLPGRTYFTKGPHDFHLHLVTFESDHWERHLVFRDYLRADPDARQRYASLKLDLAERFHLDRPAYQDGKTALIGTLDREAMAWYLKATGFAPVEGLVTTLAGLPAEVSWAVSSGWALDLHLGAPQRYHDDLDVEFAFDSQGLVQRHFLDAGWRLDQVVERGGYAAWPPGQPLAPGSHQAHARKGGEFVDLLFAPRGEGTWRFRRDERVSLPLEDAIRWADLPSGRRVPFLAPEAVLLFKSRSHRSGRGEAGPRDKDASDFARVLPSLERSVRDWLAAALRHVHGAHPWLADLESAR